MGTCFPIDTDNGLFPVKLKILILRHIRWSTPAVHDCNPLKPDVIHMHDDWETNKNMFFSPELWQEFIKPNEEKYVKRIHEYGMLYIHHSCGHIQQIIPDLVEIGMDAIEPVLWTK